MRSGASGPRAQGTAEAEGPQSTGIGQAGAHDSRHPGLSLAQTTTVHRRLIPGAGATS